MRGLTGFGLTFFLLLSVDSRADTTCVDATLLTRSTVSITRYFDDAERAAQHGLSGIQGSGWFQSPTRIVTVEHVATAMGLSDRDWKVIDIETGTGSQSIAVRIQRLTGLSTERLVVLELQTAIPTARSVAIRLSPLMPEDHLVTVAYPDRQPRSVSGRFVQYGAEGRLAGAALLEMYEGNDRLAVDHGASGAPVFDCEGRVAAVISNVITQTLASPFGATRVSTAWGMPNVVSVPIQALTEASTIELSEAR